MSGRVIYSFHPDRPSFSDDTKDPKRMGGVDSTSFTASFGKKRLICWFLLAVVASALIASLVTFFATRPPPPFNVDADLVMDSELPEGSKTDAAALRLPKELVPDLYDLQMKIYLPGYGAAITPSQNLTFDAQVSISFHLVGRTNKIVLHSNYLTFTEDSFSVHRAGGAEVPVTGHVLDPTTEKLTILLGEEMADEENGTITINYRGNVEQHRLNGLYATAYTNKDGKQKLMAITQMEATYARFMVPCLDEPEFKAEWNVTITHPEGTIALSNGRESAPEGSEPGWQTTRFSKTPRMSSYLLAAFVGELVSVPQKTKSGVEVRVWGRPEAADHIKYAALAGAKVLDAYEEYYGIKFPLDKMDMLAVPEFAAGAMENWGLVTYRETDLIYNPAVAGMREKQRIATVIAHELAHQWFGNLVTMEWWEDLWLNEGFATLVEYSGTDVISDNNYAMVSEEFVADAVEEAMAADAVPTSQPLSFRIDRASESSEAFNKISYAKGGSFLRMLRAVMGETAFQEGLQIYLKKHAYANAKAADLYNGLQEAALKHNLTWKGGRPMDVPLFSFQWTEQMGFPVVTVERMNGTHVRLTQGRYKTSNQAEKAKYRHPKWNWKWDVPVWYSVGTEGKKQIAWLDRDAPSLLLRVPEGEQIIVNVDALGFYRVDYGKEGWTAIKGLLQKDHAKFSVQTRARLISDAFAMADISRMEYPDLFDVLSYIEKEEDLLPLSLYDDKFASVRLYFGTDPVVNDMKRVRLSQLRGLYSKTDRAALEATYQDDESHRENLLRQAVIQDTCANDDADCLGALVKDFQDNFLAPCSGPDAMASTCSKVSPPLRSFTYCRGMRYALPGAFDKIWELMKRERDQTERWRLTRALTCTTDIPRLKAMLLGALDRSTSPISKQDTGSVYGTASSNPVATSFLFDMLFEQWDKIKNTVKDDNILRYLIDGCLSGMRTKEQIAKLVAWRKTQPETLTIHKFNEMIAHAYQRVEWLEKNGAKVIDYFAKAA